METIDEVTNSIFSFSDARDGHSLGTGDKTPTKAT